VTTLHKAADLFGEEFGDLEVHTFKVKDGRGYYISYTVDNTRTVQTRHSIRIEYSDGTVETTTADSEQELKLWTEHLQ
jgi:hypothetical protein